MRQRRWIGLVLLGCALILTPAPAAADDASLGRSGETVFPIGEPAVRMEAEEVLLRIGPSRTDVSLSFTFANSGPAKQVLMGFPLREKLEGRGHPELNAFTTKVDGVPVAVATEKASSGAYPGWITWPVDFGANQTVTVTNSYWGTNTYWSNGVTAAGYILKTGAVWNGTIGSALVRAKLDGILPVDLESVTPADYRWDGDDLVWHWVDFEPKRDIEVFWNPRSWQYELQAALPDDLAHLRLADQKGDHAAVKAGVQKALAAGIKAPVIAYLAVKEGLLEPQEVLGWDLGPVMVRWLQDRAGLKGSPPEVPVITRRPGEILVTLADPDGDVADWGLKAWLQPDESLTPVVVGPQEPVSGHFQGNGMQLYLQEPREASGSEVWARAWVVDGRGHRQETGLVRLAAPAVPKPVEAAPPPSLVVTPFPEPAAVPAPSSAEVRRANPLGWYLLAAFALMAGGAVLFRRLRR